MAKVKVKALKRIGRYVPGDEFEMDTTDANAYVALALVARSEAEEVEDESQPRTKRRAYRRRDMTSEE